MFLMKNIRCCNLEISIRQFSLRSARKRAHDRIYGSAHFVEHGAVAGMPDILVITSTRHSAKNIFSV